MSRNWLRSCSLSLTGAQKSRTNMGGGPADLRITFAIAASTIQSPNQGRFSIYNPNRDTVAQFMNKEFKNLQFSAGYQDNIGLIYKGDIKQSVYNKESATDTVLTVYCGDGQFGYQASRANKTLAAGYSPMDKAKVALDAMAPFGITLGTVNVDLSQPKYPRGRPFIGMARDLLRQVTLSAGAVWSIQNGQVQIIDHKKPVPGSALVLNSRTGMISIPTQTEDGIIVQSLLNPILKVHTHVQIAQDAINQAERDNGLTAQGLDVNEKNINLSYTGKIAEDGLYRVLFLQRDGDTRGIEWTDTATCIAIHGGFINKAQADADPGIELSEV